VFPAKYRIHAVLLLVALIIIFLPKFNERPDRQKAEAAQAAADQFFALVDADRFAESWQICAPLLKERVTEQQWLDQLGRTRAVAGPLVERRATEITYSTAAKDSPEGEYILIIYHTSFKARPDASEHLTVTLGADQVWRVAGYFIK